MDLVLIPAYEPDQVLVSLTQRLTAEGFGVLVVDDGSGEKYRHIFQEAQNENVTVLTLERNGGKGGALKAGMRYIRDHIPQCQHFITCDADGQHRVEDVVRVAKLLNQGERFVLTTRERNKKAPLRSQIGNNLSRFVYALLTNRYLSDNQSGLRGFSRDHLDWMIRVEKNNYDYEMNVLYYAAKMGLKITTLNIASIYIDNNASSHFNPIADTVRIYKSLYRLAMGTVISFILSQVLVVTTSLIFGYDYIWVTLPSIGWLCYVVTILLNRFVFFRHLHRFDHWSSLVYTILFYTIYTLCCALAMYMVPCIPMWIAFLVIYGVMLPLRYFLLKAISHASKHKD